MKKASQLVTIAACAWLAVPALGIEAQRLAAGERITLDGRLDEPAGSRAALLDRFWQIAPFARRDNVLRDQDMIVLNVDPVGNRKFAHFFRVNPRGSVGDGLWNEDSVTEDFSPDIEFDVVTGRFPGGWTAEFRTPFPSLRYGDPPAKEWSVMVFRNYPRDQLYRLSTSKLAKDSACFICLNEPLTGLPHPRAEVEYRIGNDTIDSLEPVEGSKRIITQRAQHLLAIWHFSARDSLRTIWQDSSFKRAPSLWEFPVSSREDSSTLSVVFGHRRGIASNLYVGATFSRSRDPDAGARSYRTEVFVKGSWTFDVL